MHEMCIETRSMKYQNFSEKWGQANSHFSVWDKDMEQKSCEEGIP